MNKKKLEKTYMCFYSNIKKFLAYCALSNMGIISFSFAV